MLMFILRENMYRELIQNISSHSSIFFLDVRPAKKDNQSGGNAGNSNAKQMSGLNNQFNSMNNPFSNAATDSFGTNKPNYIGSMNPNFGNDSTFGNSQKDLNPQNRNSGNSNFDDGNQTGNSDNDQYNGKHNNNNNNNNNNGNDPFNNPAQNRGNNQFNLGNPNRGNDQFVASHGNQNRGLNNQFGNNQMGNQNRPGGNQNRNQTNPANNQNQNASSGGGAMGTGGGTHIHRTRGTRGGKNRNKNNQNNPNNANNFRDRSPINRGNRIEDKVNREWDHKQGDRLRGNNFARDSFNDSGNRYDDFKTSGTRDANASFG